MDNARMQWAKDKRRTRLLPAADRQRRIARGRQLKHQRELVAEHHRSGRPQRAWPSAPPERSPTLHLAWVNEGLLPRRLHYERDGRALYA